MKRSDFLTRPALMALLFAGLTACSSDPLDVNTDEDGDGTYFRINITYSDGGVTRAGEDDTEVYDSGIEAEYSVSKLYVYFFNSAGNIVPMNDGLLYAEFGVGTTPTTSASDTETGLDSPTSGVGNTAGVGYTSDARQLPNHLSVGAKYHVYALCNRAYTGTIANEAAFQRIVMEDKSQPTNAANIMAGTTKGLMPMSSRSYAGQMYDEITVNADNNADNPVSATLSIERAYARITYTNTSNEFDLYNSLDDSGTSYGKVELVGYKVVNKNLTYNLFRQVGKLTDDFKLDGNTAFTSITTATGDNPYLIEPTTTLKNDAMSEDDIKALGYYFPATDLVSTLALSANRQNYQTLTKAPSGGHTVLDYVLENSMHVNAQKFGVATSIIFKAYLKPNTIYETTESGSVDKSTTAQTTQTLYYSAGYFAYDLNALAIKCGYEPSEFKNLTADSDAELTLLASYNISKYVGGYAYYPYVIRHANNSDSNTMGVMEFAIVRNNTYNLNVTKIAMPSNDDEYVDPSKDVESDELYMKVEMVIRPWIVRVNNTSLGGGRI